MAPFRVGGPTGADSDPPDDVGRRGVMPDDDDPLRDFGLLLPDDRPPPPGRVRSTQRARPRTRSMDLRRVQAWPPRGLRGRPCHRRRPHGGMDARPDYPIATCLDLSEYVRQVF